MYRTIDKDTWDDPWFSELIPEAKLLFLYLVTNRRSNPAGCFEITEKAIAFETGLGIPYPSHTQGIPIHELMGMIAGRVTWWPEHRVVFVHNFYKHQSGGSNRENFRKGAVAILAEMPVAIWCFVSSVYPEFTPDGGFPEVDVHHPMTIPYPSHGYKETVTVEVEEEVEEEETEVSRKREKRGCRIPDDLSVDGALMEWALKRGGWTEPGVRHEFEKFHHWHTGKGTVNKDWNAAFRMWITKAEGMRGKQDDRAATLARLMQEAE